MATPIRRKARPQGKPSRRPTVRILSRSQVSRAVETMAQASGTARFGAGKALIATAQEDPSRVYPHFEAVAALLGCENKIVRWGAMRILASLARADQPGKLDGLLDAYLAFIRGSNMISAANAIVGSATIALARPHLLDRIVGAILEVRQATYETPECRNVAIGHALDALRRLWAQVRARPDVAAFVRDHVSNTRPAVARKTRKLTADLP